MDSFEISVCSDCLMLAANGTLGNEDPVEDSAHAARVSRVWDAPWHIIPGDDSQGHFSHRACDGCGENLAGDRWDATITQVS